MQTIECECVTKMMCGCGSVVHAVCKRRGWGVLWNGQKIGSLSFRVKMDERVGVWWLDGVDVSVMAWCQTLCHCQCQPHQPIPQWSVTVQCVSKPLCLLPLQSVCWCCCVVPLLPFFSSQSKSWAYARVPTGSVPATQSQKREVGTIALWPHARAC